MTDDLSHDAHLRTALRHAPDHALAPPSVLNQAILSAARQAHRPSRLAAEPPPPMRPARTQRLRAWLQQLASPRWAGALATGLVAVLGLGLWLDIGQTPPIDRPAESMGAGVAPEVRGDGPTSGTRDAQSATAARREAAVDPAIDAARAAAERAPDNAALPGAPAKPSGPNEARAPTPRTPAPATQAPAQSPPRAPTAPAARSPLGERRPASAAQAAPTDILRRAQGPDDRAGASSEPPTPAAPAAQAKAGTDELKETPASRDEAPARADAARAEPHRAAELAKTQAPAPSPMVAQGAAAERRAAAKAEQPTQAPSASASGEVGASLAAVAAPSPALTLWRRARAEGPAHWTWQTPHTVAMVPFDDAAQAWLLRLVQAARGRWIDVSDAGGADGALEVRWWRDGWPHATLRIEAEGLRWIEHGGRVRYAPLEAAALQRLRSF